MNNEEVSQLISALAEKNTLAAYRCAARNYNILTSLPITIKELQAQMRLSKMPFYERIKQLRQLGLVNHEKGCGELEPTELTKEVLRGIELMKNEVNNEIIELLEQSDLASLIQKS